MSINILCCIYSLSSSVSPLSSDWLKTKTKLNNWKKKTNPHILEAGIIKCFFYEKLLQGRLEWSPFSANWIIID